MCETCFFHTPLPSLHPQMPLACAHPNPNHTLSTSLAGCALVHSLQNDINAEKARREEVVRAREELQGQVAELGGLVKSNERMLQLEKVGSWCPLSNRGVERACPAIAVPVKSYGI